ncbi:MAG: Sodium/hydrogen exchanger [Candidatus Woesebacteria bacterium GW2011_GWB1_39_10b]|uniref:Sodium/hydrogen exchanger n=2 Tax=Candidatus Woeseibacteriota TaxID=1752722 RepID=A0A0G0NKY7_9BACT|nr:MAG: sodium/hydrogen exchanger [Microgenomates group bacterium GW2011_GWC1_38_12]KKQ93417.1 MAG: Sodium/hydrogen exchanger [Candidatus Woesebacteria bacterium GW2011_GWB1_39_10b]KKR13491.1 MAG: Sodium/hydrogen exchanger [Candidatus Woesebacteria bacterium GW2011_GWA1_39_21b]
MDFSQIAILLSTAAIFGILVKRLRQPILIGYLFAGFLLAVTGLLKDNTLVEGLGKVGVALLLFLVGLEMNVRELPTVGKAAFYTGIGQIVFTFGVGMLLGILLGFNLVTSSYLAIAVSFSSTIIIVKLLSEKNALGSLYGKISVGFLLVQDFVAIVILIFLSGFGRGGIEFADLSSLAIKALLLLATLWILSKKILPNLFEKYVANSSELLFIVSIAWALGLSALVTKIGFTLEIGGFLAGLALSNLPEHLEIASRTRPLRDFFLTIFFLGLGSNLVVGNLSEILLPAIIYSLLVLVGNPIIVMIVMGFLRFKRRTSFLASVTVAQISEFSLIVVAMGYSLGHISQSHVALTVTIAAITMTMSTYLILGADKLYLKIKDNLKIFERKNTQEISLLKDEVLEDHIVLIGCYRTGYRLLSLFKKKNISFVIVDFNPEVYKKLTAENYPVIFGDIADPEILEAVSLDQAKLIISTIDGLTDNLVLLEYIRKLAKKPLSIFTASTRTNALKFYESGANYVIVPDVVAGDHIRHIIKTYGFSGDKLAKVGKNHFNRLIFT